MKSGFKQAIGPELHLVTYIHNNGARNQWRGNPFCSAGLNFQTRYVLLEQKRDRAIIRMGSCSHWFLVIGFGATWIFQETKDLTRYTVILVTSGKPLLASRRLGNLFVRYRKGYRFTRTNKSSAFYLQCNRESFQDACGGSMTSLNIRKRTHHKSIPSPFPFFFLSLPLSRASQRQTKDNLLHYP